MMTTVPRRPLADVLSDLAGGVSIAGSGQLHPTSIEFNLPVETRVGIDEQGLVLLADVPRTRVRTAFDLPVGRLVVRLVVEAPQ